MPAARVKQLPKHQKEVSRVKRPWGWEVRYELVTSERRDKLEAFQRDLASLCDKYGVTLCDGETGSIEVVERGFRYPSGFSYSATMKTQRAIRIEHLWFNEVTND